MTRDTGLGSESSQREYLGNLRGVISECARVLKPTGSLWLIVGETDAGAGRRGTSLHAGLLLTEHGWTLVGTTINVRGYTGIDLMYRGVRSDAAYFSVDLSNQVMSCPQEKYEGFGYWTLPVDLSSVLIRANCPKGGLVIDPFCGSGSVGYAARMHGMNYIGIDVDAKAIEIARKRLGLDGVQAEEVRQ
jgi:site-specific DNA-methyltransferase (adenine-specific)